MNGNARSDSIAEKLCNAKVRLLVVSDSKPDIKHTTEEQIHPTATKKAKIQSTFSIMMYLQVKKESLE